MKVLLWTAPRCVSTAFERAIMTLSNTKIFHEPYSNAYYFGPERQSDRYASTPVKPKETYRYVKSLLCKDYDGIDVIFSKDMAYCVENKYSIFLDEDLKEFKHTFLIRDPNKAIPSLYQASTNPKLTGWNYFDPIEAGFRQMYELYDFVRENLDDNPVIVDADDLLDQPDEIMKSYCNDVRIPYEPHMTSWEPGPIPDWDVWSGWHENALKSSGFTPRIKKNAQAKPQPNHPEEVLKAIEEAMPHYTYLASRKIVPLMETACGKS